MSVYVTMRVTTATADVAQQASKTGELVELRDRHGVLHRGYVRGVEYQIGVDQGWFVAFEMVDDGSLGPVLEKLCGPMGRA